MYKVSCNIAQIVPFRVFFPYDLSVILFFSSKLALGCLSLEPCD